MIIKEKKVTQLTFDKALFESGDMMAYLRDHPEEHWDRLIIEFGGSAIKFKNWCKKTYLGPRGPKKAQPRKYNRAMKYFEDKQGKKLNESIQYEDILSSSFSDIKKMNDGDNAKTLRELNQVMSRIQGSDDKDVRKAYFKTKGYYEKLVEYINGKPYK